MPNVFKEKKKKKKSSEARVDLKELHECVDKMGNLATLGRKAKKMEVKGTLIEEALDMGSKRKSLVRSEVRRTTYLYSKLEKKLQM